jgi:hypothetical protein
VTSQYEYDPNSHVEVENNHGIPDAPSMKSQMSAKKKVSRRGSAFTKEEDNVICSVFLNVSKDPITGIQCNNIFNYLFILVECPTRCCRFSRELRKTNITHKTKESN